MKFAGAWAKLRSIMPAISVRLIVISELNVNMAPKISQEIGLIDNG